MRAGITVLLLSCHIAPAPAACNEPIRINRSIVVLGEASLADIDRTFGFAERFDYAEYGSTAVCYRTDTENYLILGFSGPRERPTLSSAAISLLPPTGHERSFCAPLTDNNASIILDAHHLGQSVSQDRRSLIQRKQTATDKNRFCSITREHVLLSGKLAAYTIAISQNEAEP